MNKEQIEELKRLAEAATPGPWEMEDDEVSEIVAPVAHVGSERDEFGCPKSGLRIYVERHHQYPARKPRVGDSAWQALASKALADAEFIAAANPAAVLELIALAETAPVTPAPQAAPSGWNLPKEIPFETMKAAERSGISFTALCRVWDFLAAAPASPAAPVAQPGDERALFEAHLARRGRSAARNAAGIYEFNQSAWETWQAARALSATPAAPLAQQSEPVAWIVYADYKGHMVPRYPGFLDKASADNFAGVHPADSKAEVRPLYAGSAPAIPVPTLMAYVATDLDGRFDVGLTPKEAKERAGHGCDTTFPLFDIGSAAPAIPAPCSDDTAKDARGAALEEAATICDEMGEHWSAIKDTALLNGDVDLSNAASGEPRAAEFLAKAIRDRAALSAAEQGGK